MAIYDLPDDRLTSEQRANVLETLSYSHAVRFAGVVYIHFPAVFDDVALRLNPTSGRIPLDDLKRLTLISKSGPDDLARFMDWVRENRPWVFDEAFSRIGRIEDLEALGLLQNGAAA